MDKDTRHKIAPVQVQGSPASLEDLVPAPEVSISLQSLEVIRILVDIRMSNGMHLQQRNLTYDSLKVLVRKLEVLC